jgi:hypothetical protein
MKRIAFIIILICSFLTSNGQNKVDNYSFMKLYVTNDEGGVLLLGSKDSWEITGARYNDTISILEFVNWMGQRMGIKITNIKLRGLLTFHYSYRTNPTLMHYYTADYKSGDLVLPEGCDEIKWVKKNEIQKLIPFEEMNMIIQKINDCDYLFGGSFWITKDSITQKRYSKVIEPFYRLN